MATEHKRLAPTPRYPLFGEMLPSEPIEDRRYRIGFGRTTDELREIQKLRFEVFNVELGEGLEESFATGQDEDRFDPVCHHLMATECETGRVVGTYRMLTWETAEPNEGFYSAGEFDLDGLPERIRHKAVEIGRACIHRDHRNQRVLFLLWKGLASYMAHNRKKYLFGCCSLTSQDPAEGKCVMERLRARGHVWPDLDVRPLPGWECYDDDLVVEPGPVHIPRLFKAYLRYGAKVCGPPAIDRFFKTIDYLALIDVEELDSDLYKLYFG